MKTKLVLLLGTGILSFRIVASEPQWIIAADAREATEEEKKNEQAPEGTSRFFRTVKNAKKVTKATCTATSLGVFEFYVNGRRAGEQVLMPGFTHGLKTKYSLLALFCRSRRNDDLGTLEQLPQRHRVWSGGHEQLQPLRLRFGSRVDV